MKRIIDHLHLAILSIVFAIEMAIDVHKYLKEESSCA
jgi:hypothetical protein